VNRKMSSVKIVNLDTGHVIEADPYVLREQCIPHGYRFAEDITVEEWIEALKRAREYKLSGPAQKND